jgi:ABC-type nitrate/sulfonate/bicarbonate transport system substrate-binding protein
MRRLAPVLTLLVGLFATLPSAGAMLPEPAAARTAAQVAPLNPPATVRVGVQGSAANAPIYIGYERGYFRQEGLNVELVTFAGAQEMIPALATGQLEAGAGGIGAAVFNAIGRGIELRIVADMVSNPPGPRGAAWVVRQDLLDSGQVRTPADLRGRTLALGVRGTIADVELDVLLGQGGLTRDDIRIEQVAFADQVAAFANRSIDFAYTFEPFLASITNNRFASVFRWTSELIPYQEASVLMYGLGFGGEPARRFMVGFLRGVRDFTVAFENRPVDETIVAILTQHTTVKDPAAWQTARPAPVNPNGYTYPHSIQRNLDWFLANGLVQQRLDLDRVIDHSFVEYALERLGRVEGTGQ